MKANLISTPAYELAANVEPNEYGYSLSFESFVPTARRPELQRKLQTSLSKEGLLQLRWLIDDVLTACGEKNLERPPEREMIIFPPGKGPHVGSLFGYHQAVAKKRKLDVLKGIAEGRMRFTIAELRPLVDLVHSSLGGLRDPRAQLARDVAFTLSAALQTCVDPEGAAC